MICPSNEVSGEIFEITKLNGPTVISLSNDRIKSQASIGSAAE